MSAKAADGKISDRRVGFQVIVAGRKASRTYNHVSRRFKGKFNRFFHPAANVLKPVRSNVFFHRQSFWCNGYDEYIEACWIWERR
jgi:hypothetical protein